MLTSESAGMFFFRKRTDDDLLERSLRPCGDCDAQVHVFAETCRHCGASLELVAS
ncbi:MULTISPECIES: hypothetical protein [unclassified Crossiella]|uniref:hypothetical protein n=1 Tax=unclassified Crossiella TaxID=2620835 RepID=UPI001FFEE576|nr:MULTISPECIES: hypothetical protein [unclassified Crossiella]MCK2237235.1 hypothetical protein [Crossiella sp. S99.2]MCK2250890.1 hypothetical protein [Crossiella sp. S99.1]